MSIAFVAFVVLLVGTAVLGWHRWSLSPDSQAAHALVGDIAFFAVLACAVILGAALTIAQRGRGQN